MPFNKKEKGNVLFLILIALALFAALAYAATNSSRSGGGDINREKFKLIASQIQQHGAELRVALQRLMVINKCDLSQISFHPGGRHSYSNSWVNNYTNPNSPPDNTCHIYEPEGGGVSYKKGLPDSVLDLDSTHVGYYREYNVPNRSGIQGVGVQDVDLTMMVGGVTEEFCLHYNQSFAGLNTVPVGKWYAGVSTAWNGAFNGHGQLGDITAFNGMETGCFYHDQTGGYDQYKIFYLLHEL